MGRILLTVSNNKEVGEETSCNDANSVPKQAVKQAAFFFCLSLFFPFLLFDSTSHGRFPIVVPYITSFNNQEPIIAIYTRRCGSVIEFAKQTLFFHSTKHRIRMDWVNSYFNINFDCRNCGCGQQLAVTVTSEASQSWLLCCSTVFRQMLGRFLVACMLCE